MCQKGCSPWHEHVSTRDGGNRQCISFALNHCQNSCEFCLVSASLLTFPLKVWLKLQKKLFVTHLWAIWEPLGPFLQDFWLAKINVFRCHSKTLPMCFQLPPEKNGSESLELFSSCFQAACFLLSRKHPCFFQVLQSVNGLKHGES